MFTNSWYRMHGVSLHNVCMAYDMNGCIPVLYVCCVLCAVLMLSMIELILPLLNV